MPGGISVVRSQLAVRGTRCIEDPITRVCGLPANLLDLGEVHLGSIRVLHVT
jgi:hypothetical protein